MNFWAMGYPTELEKCYHDEKMRKAQVSRIYREIRQHFGSDQPRRRHVARWLGRFMSERRRILVEHSRPASAAVEPPGRIHTCQVSEASRPDVTVVP